MLHVFHVDSGRMMTFDMNLAVESIESLKKFVQEQSKIAVDKQVLLISGGESLESDMRVCSYSTGTDTNPIFLFSKSSIESPISPLIVSDYPSESDIQLRVREHSDMPVSFSTVSKRAQLAQQLDEHAKKQLSTCEKLVHEQHLQQQGWSAVVANLEDIVSDFTKRSEIFERSFNDYMEERESYLVFLGHFQSDLELLRKIPVLPALLEAEQGEAAAAKEVSLYDWMSAADTESTMAQLFEHCSRGLAQFDRAAIDKAMGEARRTLAATDNANMKAVKGMEERLSGLELLMRDVKQHVQQQGELAQAFQVNLNRANNTKDHTALPNLCMSHKKQLQMMAYNHERICDIERRCIKAKEELCANINLRLRWVMYIEDQILEQDQKLVIYHENLKRLRRHLEVLQQIHVAPTTYLCAVAEVVRRRAFSQTFLLWASELSCHLLTIHNEEAARRREFHATFDGHFLTPLFPGLGDAPPPFATQPPPAFDADLPRLGDDDVERLRLELPQLARHLVVPEPAAIADFVTVKALVKKVEEEEKAKEEVKTEVKTEVKEEEVKEEKVKEEVKTEVKEEEVKEEEKEKVKEEEVKEEVKTEVKEEEVKEEKVKEEEEKVKEEVKEEEKVKEAVKEEVKEEKVKEEEEKVKEEVKEEVKEAVKEDVKEEKVKEEEEEKVKEEVKEEEKDAVKEEVKEEQVSSAAAHGLERCCESETDTEEFETVGRSAPELTVEPAAMQDASTLTEVGEKSAAPPPKPPRSPKNPPHPRRSPDRPDCPRSPPVSGHPQAGDFCGEEFFIDESLPSSLSFETGGAADFSKQLDTANTVVALLQDNLQTSRSEHDRLRSVVSAVHQVASDAVHQMRQEVAEIRRQVVEQRDCCRMAAIADALADLVRIDEEQRRRQRAEGEAEKDRAVREAKERMTREHRDEIEGMRSRFRLMSMRRSPSESNLERSAEMVGRDKVEEALRLERDNWTREAGRRRLQLEQSRERERRLMLECAGHCQKIRAMEEAEHRVRELEEREDELVRCNRELKCQLAELMGTKRPDSMAASDPMVASDRGSTSAGARPNAAAAPPPKMTVDSCRPGDVVVLAWDPEHGHYRVMQDNRHLYFVHSDYLQGMGLEVRDGTPNRTCAVGEVVDKEYCSAKKSENRYKVPKLTKFFRVKVQPPGPADRPPRALAQSVHQPRPAGQPAARLLRSHSSDAPPPTVGTFAEEHHDLGHASLEEALSEDGDW